MRVSVGLEGLEDLQANLDRLTTATGRAALTRAGIKAMQPMAVIASARAPVLSGDLAASVAVSAKAKGSVSDASRTAGKQAFAVAMRAGLGVSGARSALRSASRAVRAASGADAPVVELFMGPVQPRNRKDAIKTIVQEFGSMKMAPNAYMRPAFDQDKDAMVKRLGALIMEEVNKSIARAAARAARAGR